ncbi:MAG: GntR family transcriptional regulator [Halanaerobiaceae bacterium]
MKNFNIRAVDPHSYEPLRIQVYNLLRQSVLEGKIDPGTKLTETGLAEQLNVSRTPIREAFRMLELENLIIIIPQQGVFVAGIKSRGEIDDIFRVRLELEGLAAYLAARNISQQQIKELNELLVRVEEGVKEKDLKKCIEIDIAFHELIKKASDNRWLKSFLDSLFEQVTRFRAKSLGLEGRMEKALVEHKKLGAAIASGNQELARRLAHQHIQSAWNSIITVFEQENNDR